MTHARAAELRRRASNLRILADQMCNTPSMTLQSHATVDTWEGPCASGCTEHLATAQRAVHTAIDDLADQAWSFDRRADELDAAAFLAERQLELELERAEQTAVAAAASAAARV